jgi:tetratricopeptide (TPR) repeat protein
MTALCFGVRRASGWPLTEQDAAHAVALASRSIEIEKFDAQILGSAGFVFMHLAGQFERGAALTAEAVRLNPNNSRAWLWFGFIRMWGGDYAAAKECFERSIRINPFEPYDFLAPLGIGWALIMLERHDQAWAWVQRAKRLGPKFLAASEAEILCLVRFGQVEEARRRFEALARLDPALENAAVYRARSRFRRGADVERLIETLRAAGLQNA